MANDPHENANLTAEDELPDEVLTLVRGAGGLEGLGAGGTGGAGGSGALGGNGGNGGTGSLFSGS